MISEELLKILACPTCKGSLKYEKAEENESLWCEECQVRYPVTDGVPNLLPVEKKEKS